VEAIQSFLNGFDSLAKLMVCTIALFSVPTITRKYAQNIGIAAGREMMMGGLFLTGLMGGGALVGKTRSALSSAGGFTKDLIGGGIKSLGRGSSIGAEKLFKHTAKNFLPSNSVSANPVKSRFEEFFNHQERKKNTMRDEGIAPFTKSDERRLKRSKDPTEIAHLSNRKNSYLDFENRWKKQTELEKTGALKDVNSHVRNEGILPWTKEDEARLQTSSDPTQVRSLSQRKRETEQFLSRNKTLNDLNKVDPGLIKTMREEGVLPWSEAEERERLRTTSPARLSQLTAQKEHSLSMKHQIISNELMQLGQPEKFSEMKNKWQMPLSGWDKLKFETTNSPTHLKSLAARIQKLKAFDKA